jgi:adenylate kinase
MLLEDQKDDEKIIKYNVITVEEAKQLADKKRRDKILKVILDYAKKLNW